MGREIQTRHAPTPRRRLHRAAFPRQTPTVPRPVRLRRRVPRKTRQTGRSERFSRTRLRSHDVTIKIGLHAPSLSLTGFGTRFFDYDNDGRLDLLVLNGAVRNMEGLARKGELYPLQQRNQLFQNAGPGGYQEVTASSGEAFEMEEVSRGASLGDVDNDGDTDVVVFNNNGPARLLLNQAGNRRHWLGLRLIEGATARDVLQARVEVLEQDGLARWRRVHTDGSYCSSSDPRILFGLGKSGEPRTVRVHWPGGTAEEWPNLEVDRYWVLQKGKPPR